MATLVLGAGLVGTVVSYYLARGGEKATVIDRQPAAGLETSFANGGLVTPSMSDPWAAPGTPMSILRWLGDEEAPFLLRMRALPGLVGWSTRFLLNCNERKWRETAEILLQLMTYSRDLLDALYEETNISRDRSSKGTLKVFRDPVSMKAATHTASLKVSPARPLLRGGGEFRIGVEAHSFNVEGDRVAGEMTDHGTMTADTYVLALASHSARVARTAGLRIPVFPAKGYSVTFSAQGQNDVPTIPIIDDRRKIAVTPLGQRIRVAGTVEFTG